MRCKHTKPADLLTHVGAVVTVKADFKADDMIGQMSIHLWL